MKNRKIVALIVAAGSGERFGGKTPKQYSAFMGHPLLYWSIAAFQNHPLVSEVHVVIHPDHEDWFKKAIAGLRLPPPIHGGATRQESVQKGLTALRGRNPDIVLIHDAARPLVSEILISRLCEAAINSGAAIPALSVTDTVKRQQASRLMTESREGLYTVQTPQAFRFELIDRLHQKYQGKSFTDDAALCENDQHPVTLIEGERDNIKLTQSTDMALAEQYLLSRKGDVRTGQGYDVHRLIPRTGAAQKLMLCGIEIPHDKTLEGHSDADVGLHAITDALLATISAGDIGQHFSPADPRWKNADSATFLAHAAQLVNAHGGVIAHVDVTLICEAPKISPRRAEMRQRIADILQLPAERISVKATTTEGLGFTGRQEGIAAQSVVTVRLPFTHVLSPEQQNEDLQKWAS